MKRFALFSLCLFLVIFNGCCTCRHTKEGVEKKSAIIQSDNFRPSKPHPRDYDKDVNTPDDDGIIRYDPMMPTKPLEKDADGNIRYDPMTPTKPLPRDYDCDCSDPDPRRSDITGKLVKGKDGVYRVEEPDLADHLRRAKELCEMNCQKH